MQFRVVMLNLEQDHKRWSDRHPLISAEIAALKPDVIAFNEVSVPLQTAKVAARRGDRRDRHPVQAGSADPRERAVEDGGRSVVDPVSDRRNRQS